MLVDVVLVKSFLLLGLTRVGLIVERHIKISFVGHFNFNYTYTIVSHLKLLFLDFFGESKLTNFKVGIEDLSRIINYKSKWTAGCR